MAQCKECGDIQQAKDLEDGICEKCRGIFPEEIKDEVEEYVYTEDSEYDEKEMKTMNVIKTIVWIVIIAVIATIGYKITSNEKMVNVLKDSMEETFNKSKDVIELVANSALNSVPECSSEQVLPMVNELYTSIVEKNSVYVNGIEAGSQIRIPRAFISITNTRATEYNKDIKKRTCVAQASYYAPCGSDCEEESVQEVELRYSIQLNEQNSNEFYVEVKPDVIERIAQQQLKQQLGM